jgi:transposase
MACGGSGGHDAKKKTLRASEQERPDVQRKRDSFQQQTQQTDAHRLIFFDEFGTNLGMTRRYGYAPEGERAYGKAPNCTDPNITLVLGLGLRGIVAPLAFEGAMNGDIFEQYVREQAAPLLQPGDIVVWDGLSSHHVKGAREAVEARGATCLPLPPYSPELSPVEECGSKIKQAIRAEEPRTVEAVYDAMGRAIGRVTPQDARGWFDHASRDRAPRPRPRNADGDGARDAGAPISNQTRAGPIG